MEEDTTPRQINRYHELLREMTPGERLRKVAALSRAVRDLAEAGIRQRHPGAPAEEIRARLAVRLYGRKSAVRLCQRVPDDEV